MPVIADKRLISINQFEFRKYTLDRLTELQRKLL